MRRIRCLPRFVPALSAAAVLTVVLAGCGGGDDESSTERSGGGTATSTETSANAPEPTQPIAKQIPAFERAASSLDCEDALKVVHPVMLPDPENPESKKNCDNALYAVRRVRDFKATDSQELGTAAVVDGNAKDDDVKDLIWALDADGSFKWIGGFSKRPQVNQKLQAEPGRADPGKTADAFLQALRDDDCKAALEELTPGSRLYYKNEKVFCEKFDDTFTAAPESLGSRLKRDPKAEPVALGATQDWAVFAVATKPSGYRTLIVGSGGKEPKVVDVVPAER